MTAHQREFDDPSNGHFSPIALRSPDDYALVIGVNHYPQLRPLRGAIADAQAFAAWLIDPMGGNVPQKNVFTILSSPEPLAPVGHEMNDALETIFARAEKSGAGRLYFYFSGHGCVGDRPSDLALCLANWSNLRRRAALSSDAWVDVVVRSGLFAEVAVFLDCCRIWATRAVGLPPQIDFVKPLEREHSTRVFVAYAAEYQRAALEVAEKSAEVRGIFTRVLIDGLRSNARDKTGKISAPSLKQYLEKSTQERALALGLHQRAEVVNGFEDSAQFGPSRDPSRTIEISSSNTTHIGAKIDRNLTAKLDCSFASLAKQDEARLFLVLRNSSKNEWSIFHQGRPILNSDATKSISKNENGENWREISWIAKPGAYVLRCSGSSQREIAVHLFPRSTTQIVIDDASIPHFETAQVNVVTPRLRNQPDFVAKGLAILDSGTRDLPTEWSNQNEVFDDPMLGLIAGHLLARAKVPDVERIERIAARVEGLLGPCIDVEALRLRVALLLGRDLPKTSYSDPPMLREGLLAFVEASHKVPQLIAPGSLLEHACVERFVDSPLSSWPVRTALPENEDWLTTIVEDLATAKGGDTSTLEVTTIARELGVPTQAIETRIRITRQRTQATKIPVTRPLEPIRSVSNDSLEIRGYTLQRVIGKGGMGRVYLAKRIATNETVAIK